MSEKESCSEHDKYIECPECGREYKGLGTHWQHKPNHRPELTQHQKEVITGLLMGDGHLSRGDNGRNPYIQCAMVSPNYLQYLDSLFGSLSTGVNLIMTAEQSAEKNRDMGVNKDAKTENYSNIYRWQTRSLPELQEYADWYSSGEKVWPDGIDLSPTVLRHWYCGDGHWGNSGTKNVIEIGMANELENTDKIDKYFEQVNLPTPSNYRIYEYDDGRINCVAEWTKAESRELWDYMGEPLPDFEYKWPEEYR